MKYLLYLFSALVLIYHVVTSGDYPKGTGCARTMFGDCFMDCPFGTHEYTEDCKNKIPEPTCNTPNPQLPNITVKYFCKYSGCYCDEPTVRDQNTLKCVKLEDCTEHQPEDDD